jgi:hypothetical protein
MPVIQRMSHNSKDKFVQPLTTVLSQEALKFYVSMRRCCGGVQWTYATRTEIIQKSVIRRVSKQPHN